MAKYFDNANVCEHHQQHSGCVNLLGDDHYLDDESRSMLPLLANSDEPATFCMRCRSLSNSSSVIQYESDLRTASGDWAGNLHHHECNGRTPITNSYYAPVGHPQSSINFGDGADIPLLTNGESYGNVAINPLHLADEEWDHCHAAMPQPHNTVVWKQLVSASVMCLIFMVAEIVGGYIAGSLAVMTDAAHLLSDLVGFVVSLSALWVGRWPATRKLSFGYHRAEVLGALLSVALIWVLTGVFVYLAVLRLVSGDYEINADTMMIVAAVGVVINIVMGLVLHGMCHNLGHGHSHSQGSQSAHRTSRNINLRAAIIHVVGDLIQSVGVLVSSIVIKFYPGMKMADPICTFLFSLLVLATTVAILRDTTHVLMEGFPRHLDYDLLVGQLRAIDGAVQHVHGLQVWSLTAGRNAMSVHLAVDSSANHDLILKQALRLVRRKYDIYNATIQVEKYCAETMQNCLQCKLLTD